MESKNVNVLDYSGQKSNQVVHSLIGADCYALADAFDRAFILWKQIEKSFDKIIPLHKVTYFKQFFDSITKEQETTLKHFTIDISAAL